MTNQSGQVVIALLLTILVGLSIGLIVTQRTVTDVTTSSQTEQSTRAFSAAEAGIERALSTTSGSTVNVQTSETQNESAANVKINRNLPNPGQALEYLTPIDKVTTAQFWLADPDTLAQLYPPGKRIHLYFGNPNPSDTPAIEIYFIYDTGAPGSPAYQISPRTFVDTIDRSTQTGITNICSTTANSAFRIDPPAINTTNSSTNAQDRSFRCRVELITPSAKPIMIRARILNTSNPQRIALAPATGEVDGSGVGVRLPYQATLYYSTGSSGQSQTTISLFQGKKLLNNFLDYAIYSNSDLTK